ncbi:NF-kappa-B inhibitor alpha-like [Babylonia areolata]|uniref:NF-kappa-B inhibitor alpha-like n=1 Tax=Babylonia areolata TaxID=304850 RepID=UPI003FD1D12B
MTLPKQTTVSCTKYFTAVPTGCADVSQVQTNHGCLPGATPPKEQTQIVTLADLSSEKAKSGVEHRFTERRLVTETSQQQEQEAAILSTAPHSSSVPVVLPQHQHLRAENSSITKFRASGKEGINSPCLLQNMCDIFPDKDGDTLVHVAVLHNSLTAHLAEVIHSLGLQEQVNHLNHLQQTPLHLALLTGHHHAISLLLRPLEASITIQDGHGNTPLHTACQCNDLCAAQMLCHLEQEEEEAGGGRGEGWRGEEVRHALETRNYEGVACLHLAVLNGNAELVAFLLRTGADVNAREGKSGRTALHLAVDTSAPCVSVITLLLLHPHLHINATNFSQQTALQLARGRGHLHLVDLLLAHGAEWLEGCHGYYSFDSDEEDDDFIQRYDDMCIGGQPVSHTRCV